jgi:hypothetical protein
MPIEAMYTDAMLGIFRNMLKESVDKGLSGENLDGMRMSLDRMEKLAGEMDDFSAYSATLTTENLFGKFSDYYSRLLAGAAKSSYDTNSPYDENADKALLNQTLQAYRDTIKSLQSSKEQAKEMKGDEASDVDVLFKDKIITDAIEKVISLGESGLSYPDFLRTVLELGLDKAMEGSVATREGLVFLHDFQVGFSFSPYLIEQQKLYIDLFDEMKKTASFGVPDIMKFNLGCEKADLVIKPKIDKWNAIVHRRDELIFDLYDWILSYTSMAPHIEPWSLAPNPVESVIETQDCNPGKIKVKEKIVQRYWGMNFTDLLKHEAMSWEVKYHYFYWSQEMMDLLVKEVYPVCLPFNKPSAELISKMEKIYKEKRFGNPELILARKRTEACFDGFFGKGEYERRFPFKDTYPPAIAAPWDFEKFIRSI